MTEPRAVPPLVKAQALRRVFSQGGEEIAAVTGANCVILPGDRIAVTGPSGSGKSTFLNLLAGLDVPTSGELTWPARQKGQSLRPTYISIALQMPDMLPALTVVENVEVPLLLNHTQPEAAHSAARDILEMLDLTDLADQLPEELSGGQAQRVVLARSLVTRPSLILADEPTGQLDHPTARNLFDQLFKILEDRDSALLIATHDRSVSERMPIHWTMQRGDLETSAS